jgi:hypothetical protein
VKNKLIKIVAVSIASCGFAVIITCPGMIREWFGPNKHLFELTMQTGFDETKRASALEELSKIECNPTAWRMGIRS